MKNLDLNNYYYDDYFDYDHDDVLYTDSQNKDSVVETCIIPSVQQVSSYILVLLISCVICRISWFVCGLLLKHADWLKHLMSLVFGLAPLYTTIGHNIYIIILLTIMAYVVIRILFHLQTKNLGAIVGIVVITMNLAFELAFATAEMWNSVRGIQMVIAMKVISIAFDMEAKEDKEKHPRVTCPTLVAYLGFVFCPASCTVGPWIPYSVYIRALQKSTIKLSNTLIWTISNTVLAILTLCASNCLVPLLCSDRAGKWLRAYRDALIVRNSHYFISFLSQATLAATGISWDSNMPNRLMGSMVAKPWLIEFPRSISSIVRNWNLPMHTWLKTYIFYKSHNRFNNYLIAIFITYITSSLLHGLYFQIHAVLLTLACFAYVENILRNKLANIFDACITASKCCKPCSYAYCSNQPKWWKSSSAWCVITVNIFFSLLSMFHLSYLGIMLSAGDESGSSFYDGLAKWQQLGFTNHWIVLITFAFNTLI